MASIPRRQLKLIVAAIATVIALVSALQIDNRAAAANAGTRTLHSGWNLIAWLAEPMSAQELFLHHEMNDLVRAVKWVVGTETPTILTRPTIHVHSDWHVHTGDVLWLQLPEKITLTPFWLGKHVRSGAVHRLQTGVNAVAWVGEHDLPLAVVAASLPTRSAGVGMFEARTQKYSLYPVNRLGQGRGTAYPRVAYGDVIIVYNTAAENWVQLYGMQANIIFGVDVPEAEQDAFRKHLALVESVLTNRFGLPALEFDFYLANTWNALYDAVEAQGLGPFPTETRNIGNHCAISHGLPPHWNIGIHCRIRPNPADSSFALGLLQAMGVPHLRSNSFAAALQLGFSGYTRRALLDPELAQFEHESAIADSKNDPRIVIGKDPSPAALGHLEYLLATFVAGKYGEQSFGRYFAALAELDGDDAAANRAAELAFETSEARVAELFASWRLAVAPPVSISGADRIQIVGPVDAALSAKIRNIVLAVEEWIGMKFGHSFDPPEPWLITTASTHCGRGWGIAVGIGGACVEHERVYAHEFFHHVQRDVNQGLQLPDWFVEGTATYADALFGEHIGVTSYAARRAGWVSAARRFDGKLSDQDLVEHYGPSYYLGALATEWLVASAGENSYYQLLKQHGDSESFARAFESTFQLDLGEFYRQYGIWRASGFPQEEAGLRQ